MRNSFIELKFLLVVLCIEFLFLNPVFPQIKIHKSYSTEDGLVQGQVNDILQDKLGYIWIATQDGVSKWDGNYFQNFTTKNGLATSYVLDIEEGPDSTLYFATYGGGITTYKNGIFDTLNTKDGLSNNFISNIYFSKNNVMYVECGGTLFSYKNKIFENLSKKLKMPAQGFEEIIEDENGNLFLGTSNGIIKIYDDKFEFLSYNNKKFTEYINRLNLYNGKLYCGTNNGLFIFDNNKLVKDIFDERYSNVPIADILTDSENNLIFASENGVYVKTKNSFDHISVKNGLNYHFAYSLLQDNNGTIYIGTDGYGVNVLNLGRIENYNTDFGLTDNYVTCINSDNSGNILIGTKKGISLFESEKNKISPINKNLANLNLLSVLVSKNGITYLGTADGLVISDNNKIKTINQVKDFSNDWIYCLAESKNGKVIIGKREGLFILENDRLKKVNFNKGPHDGYIESLLALKDGRIAVGTHGKGLYIFNDDSFTKSEKIIESGIINTIYEKKDGTLLIGTDKNGLTIWKNNFPFKLDRSIGLLNDRIVGITEDKFGNIYAATQNGVNVIEEKNNSFNIRTITKEDGLISNNCSYRSIFTDENGNVWIGTSLGITKYNPQKDLPITNPPKIYLTGFEIFNVPQNLEKFKIKSELNHDENYLKFIFTGINFSAPKKIKYSYHLSGVDRDWVLSDNNFVQYTHLTKGNYTFQVKARNEWGYWSEPVSLAFTVLPAWWETWWFRLSVISLLGAMLWAAFQYRLNYLIKLERLRTKIASDLHDDVGSILTQISMNVDLLGYQKDTTGVKEKSSFIMSKCNDVIGIMSDIVWSIDSRNDNLESFTDRVFNFASTFLKDKNIELKFVNNINKKQIPFKIDVRQNLMLIAKEAINNAVKYSECSELEIIFSDYEDNFTMQISDNGKGFEIDSVKKGNGLKNMKMRAEAIKGKLEFINQNGFTVKVTV
ncbi:MAG: hypothetical protein H6612_08870 [Ignavibacteriales bacterium]|nr:hypothetical protein [Ignavibacteriales bacterium]